MKLVTRSPASRAVSMLPAAGLLLAGGALGAQAPDSAAFVTRLGDDTLAVERVVRTPRRVEAEVLLRTPRTSLTRYVMELDEAGAMQRFEAATYEPSAAASAGASAAPTRREVVERRGDSLVVNVTGGAQPQSRTVAAAPGTLPFLDMIHWPYEVALVRARPEVGGRAALPLLTGRSVSEFGLERKTADTVAITHPTRGTMHARIDANGRLLGLDAAGTTRAVVVERRPWLELAPLAARYAAADAAGRSFGALAGRGAATDTVHGATLVFDYGTPSVRGREIWGALVPFGKVWRTGANRATHVRTDRELLVGDVVVPAGEYTLFSIPERDGGRLIINRQTGQNGQEHDAARDLARVPMRTRALAEPVELFTIEAAETPEGGELRLKWDRTEYYVPFKVRAP
jgi:hypothetical protein